MQPAITCHNCGNVFEGKYCNRCGQKAFHVSDKRVVRFMEEGLHFVTHFDGTIFTTLKTILFRPGQLSEDYAEGRQKRYFKPMSFFLLLVILYLVFPLVEGLNMRMLFHMNSPYYGELATGKVEHYLRMHPGITMDQLSESFARKSEKTSKLLLVAIVPACALVLWGIGFSKRKFFYDHMVLSAEINSFYLISNFFIIPALFMLIWMIYKYVGIPTTWNNDYVFTFTGQIATAIYTAAAMKRFYGFSVWQLVLGTCIFMFFHDFLVYVLYKFVLFIIAFNLIH